MCVLFFIVSRKHRVFGCVLTAGRASEERHNVIDIAAPPFLVVVMYSSLAWPFTPFLNFHYRKVLAAVAEEEKLAEKLNKRTSQTSQTSTVASAQKVPLLPVADMVAKARSGCKLTKAEFMLQRRQIRDQAKVSSCCRDGKSGTKPR